MQISALLIFRSSHRLFQFIFEPRAGHMLDKLISDCGGGGGGGGAGVVFLFFFRGTHVLIQPTDLPISYVCINSERDVKNKQKRIFPEKTNTPYHFKHSVIRIPKIIWT